MQPSPDATPLPWDSAFFGFSVVRLREALNPDELRRVLHKLRSEGVRLAYWMPDAAAGLERLAQSAGGWRAGERVTLVAEPLRRTGSLGERTIQRYRGPAEDPQLAELAVAAGALSRFAVDPAFPPGSAERLYRQWIQRSVSGELAEAVFIYSSPAGAPVGLVTAGGDPQTGEIGLLAVAESMRGRGIGRALTVAALEYFASTGRSCAKVVTQGANAAACAVYLACGFKRSREQEVWHFWL